MSKEENVTKAELNEEIQSNQEEQTGDNKESENSENNTNQEDILAKKNNELEELNSKYLRLYSEYDNFRRRTAKEKIELINTSGADVLKDLLPIIDDFERAIANNEKVEDPESLKEGFSLIYNKTKHLFEQKGLKSMDSKGETFDVDKHEALTQIPAPSEDLKGKVVDVIEKGYLLNDKVIRFAKVVVGQ